MSTATITAPVAPRQRASTMAAPLLFKAAIASMAAFITSASWAQCGVGQSCPPSSPVRAICSVNVCFLNAKAKARYEQKNNYTIPNRCNGKTIDINTQCCVQDSKTGIKKIRQKQYTELDAITLEKIYKKCRTIDKSKCDINIEAAEENMFKWDVYEKECPNRKQSQAAPDELWAQCEVGKKHSASDDYPVMFAEKNGAARSYCIDGCSTPPAATALMVGLGKFIFSDRNNPTGAGRGGIGDVSSFLAACSAHDKCYQTCNSNNQEACDNNMLSDMYAACDQIPEDHRTIIPTGKYNIKLETRKHCKSAADTMHSGLERFGLSAFNMRRQQYCQCC